jgi:hypothetical protein
MGSGNEAAKTRGIAFGFQVVLGTLVNAILNDPGPLSIHDQEMEVRLSNCLLQLLEAEIRPTASPQRLATWASAGSRQSPASEQPAFSGGDDPPLMAPERHTQASGSPWPIARTPYPHACQVRD